jgi:hypothetical protein
LGAVENDVSQFGLRHHFFPGSELTFFGNVMRLGKPRPSYRVWLGNGDKF